MTEKEYFDKEYGNNHIKDVVDLKDLESLYGLMEEYADIKAKEAYEANQISKEEFQSLINNSLRNFSEDEISTDVALDLGGILYDNLIDIFPTYEQWKESKTKEQ